MAMLRCQLQLLFTPALCAADPWTTLRQAIAGGVDLVQWRDKNRHLPDFHRTLTLCRAAGVPLVVNDDVALAVEHRTHGAHIGQDDLPAATARRLLTDQWLGISTHDPEQIAAAASVGADSIGYGPCFATATKGYAAGLPRHTLLDGLRRAQQLGLPLFAIGGITRQNLPQLVELGVERIAVSSAILAAADPASAAAELRQLLPTIP